MVAQTSQVVVNTYHESGGRQEDSSSGFERSVTLRASRNGHFYATADINGTLRRRAGRYRRDRRVS